jgi:smad nuclear-interacting protein 1
VVLFHFFELTMNHVDLLHINRQSAYLTGRDKAVVDIPLDHPSCSKQHAVIQRA